MAKRRYPIGEPEVTLTYRTNPYPLGSQDEGKLFDEIEALVDSDRCEIQSQMGEVRITRLSFEYASMVELLLNDRKVLNGKCTLRKQE